ncbi:MAG: glycoside hydrolase family 16 protein [Capsulimonadales bacterium]|nr:glycoside hydrolase family 16 protein [Capsulimonadales bacterium]
MLSILTGVSPLVLIVSQENGTVKAPPRVPPGYRLFWRDEFSGTIGSPPNPRFWNHETGASGWGNNELQNYVKDGEHARIVADPAAVDRKALQIKVTSEGPGKYTSARLQTAGKVSIQYGYIEARIRLPYGQGIWSAFWMLGSDIFNPEVGWPKCGEIDIMENIGKREWWGRNEGSLHGPGYSGADSLHEYIDMPEGVFFKDGYHLFAILWEKDRVEFYVDGKKYRTRTPADIPGKPWAFNRPFFLVTNVAVGGNFPGSPDETTIFPQEMRIDYVRIYRKASDNKPAAVAPGKGKVGGGTGKVLIDGED